MDGAVLAGAYGPGRATPLVAIVMLARGGVDALQFAVRHTHRLDRALAWGLAPCPSGTRGDRHVHAFIVIDGTLEFVGVPREGDLRQRIAATFPPPDSG